MCVFPARFCVFVHASLPAERRRWPDGGHAMGFIGCEEQLVPPFPPDENGRCG